jgi:hypothetical protein
VNKFSLTPLPSNKQKISELKKNKTKKKSMNKKRKGIELQPSLAAEKKQLMSMSDVDQHHFRCWCETLHRLSYPRLVNFAASLFSKPKSEIIQKFTKRQLCELLARLPTKFTQKELSQLFNSHLSLPTVDFKINDAVLDAIENLSPEELSNLDRFEQRLSDSKCQDAFGNITNTEKQPFYSLFDLRDPVSLSLVTDFLRVPTKENKNPWLFNFQTLENIRQKHPLTKEPLSEFQISGTHVDTKERSKARQAIREEWGYSAPVPESEFTLDEKKQNVLRQAWQLPQLFQPLVGGMVIPEEPGLELGQTMEEKRIAFRLNNLMREIDRGADEKERVRRNQIMRWLSERPMPPTINEIQAGLASIDAARQGMQQLHQQVTTQFGPLSLQVFVPMVHFIQVERGQMP